MKKTILFSLTIFLGFLSGIIASEPVTKTKFYSVFNYLPEINFVETRGMLDGNSLPFLIDDSNPLDQKAAVINTLLVNNQNKNNALTYKMYIARSNRENFETLDLTKLTAAQLFCLGYLTLMDEDGATANALPILEMARNKDQKSKTIAVIHAIAKAQAAVAEGENCAGWVFFNQVMRDASLTNDMNSEIVARISGSMQPLGEGCE